jgi:hypothetical protein
MAFEWKNKAVSLVYMAAQHTKKQCIYEVATIDA